ncbi:DUF309 domain-containing protein [Neobacillus dielmonensis]|uniref:DUF309 domain-containing protein n=1 Tax=Neobacillus dielmonensis TaxID=1347369 RepID=UPI0005A64419|nr:DUF309 domain-containing protein [Neobacillus dielmonensis]
MYPKEYVDYLVHFHGDRDYFECHEILEEYWKKTDPGNKDSIWVGLILLAVSAYHHRRKNFHGARKTLEKAIPIFKSHSNSIFQLGINEEKFTELLRNRLQLINKNQAYESFALPIDDLDLQQLCIDTCKEYGYIWGDESNMENKELVHRHMLRDRTSVIEERYQAQLAKRGGE